MSTNEKKSGNKNVDKHKQMRNSRQNDKLEQWVMHRTVENEVQESILGSEIQKVFFLVYSLYYTDKAIQSVSLVINSQLEAETH